MAETRKSFLLEDGRRAERVVKEEDGCEGTKTIEVYAEPKIEMKLNQRIIEKKKPIVFERETEFLDENGEIVEKTVESMEPKVNMQVVDRIVSAASLPNDGLDVLPDCSVTREELRDDIAQAMITLAKTLKANGDEPVAMMSAPKVSMQSVIEDRIQAKSGSTNIANIILLAVIAAQVTGLAWILFVM